MGISIDDFLQFAAEVKRLRDENEDLRRFAAAHCTSARAAWEADRKYGFTMKPKGETNPPKKESDDGEDGDQKRDQSRAD